MGHEALQACGKSFKSDFLINLCGCYAVDVATADEYSPKRGPILETSA